MTEEIDGDLFLFDDSFVELAAVNFAAEEIEEDVLFFPDLLLSEGAGLFSLFPLPFDSPFCLDGCTKSFCFFVEAVSFFSSSVLEEYLCSTDVDRPLTMELFFTFSDVLLEIPSVFSEGLIGTRLLDLILWAEAAEAVVVGAEDSGCSVDEVDNDDGASGGGADAVCLEEVWTRSKSQSGSLLVASSGLELVLLC